MNYFDWLDHRIVCEKCGWTGLGRTADTRESFAEGNEYECPNCQHYFGFVGFPTLDETIADDRADPLDKSMSTLRLQNLEEFESRKLSSPDQLPELPDFPLWLVWSIDHKPMKSDVVILNDGAEIWREMSWYENYRRFCEVAVILKQKYGSRLKDLIPTDESELDLYGDTLASIEIVRNARANLAGYSLDRPWHPLGKWNGAVDHGAYFVRLIEPGRWLWWAKVPYSRTEDSHDEMSVDDLLLWCAEADDGAGVYLRRFRKIIRSETDDLSKKAIFVSRSNRALRIKQIVGLRSVEKPLGWNNAIEVEVEDGRHGLLRSLPTKKRTALARSCTKSSVSLGDTFKVAIDRKSREAIVELLNRADGIR